MTGVVSWVIGFAPSLSLAHMGCRDRIPWLCFVEMTAPKPRASRHLDSWLFSNRGPLVVRNVSGFLRTCGLKKRALLLQREFLLVDVLRQEAQPLHPERHELHAHVEVAH